MRVASEFSPIGYSPQVLALGVRMVLKRLAISACAVALLAGSADAHVVKLRIEHREPILGGKAFGPAGAYEKLVGKVDFALDPKLAINKNIVDLGLTPKERQGRSRIQRRLLSCSSRSTQRRAMAGCSTRSAIAAARRCLLTSRKPRAAGPHDGGRVRRRRADEPGLYLALAGLAVGCAERPDAHGHAHRHRKRQEDHRAGAGQFHPQ